MYIYAYMHVYNWAAHFLPPLPLMPLPLPLGSPGSTIRSAQAMSHRSLARSCHLVRLLVIFLRGIRAIGHLVAVLDLLQHVGEMRGHEFRQVLLVQGG